MPVYEFYCRSCHVRLAFFSRRIDTETQPACPHCQTKKLQRQISVFSVNKKTGSETSAAADETALRQIGDRLARLDESDHETTAELTAALYDTAGGTPGEAMRTALSRLRSGDDPVNIESELANDIDAEIQAPASSTGGQSIARVAATERPRGEPSVDPVLYELKPDEQ